MIAIGVPYKSQWDADASRSKGDCGIVSVAMILKWKGKDISPDILLDMAGLPGGRATYTFSELMKAGSAGGVPFKYVHPATWDVIKLELQQGRPVIPLLDYEYISNNLDRNFKGNHFWVVVGYDGDYVLVNDPDWWQPRREEGHMRRIPLMEFEKAIGATGDQALFLV